jgi:hypothetical protein
VRPDGPTGGSGGGAAAVVGQPAEPMFTSAAELSDWWPDLAAVTAPLRDEWMSDMDRVVERLGAFSEDDDEKRRVRSLTTSARPIVDRLMRTGDHVSDEFEKARGAGILNEELFVYALSIASWAVNVNPGEEPSAQALYFLGDRRLRFILKFYAPVHV